MSQPESAPRAGLLSVDLPGDRSAVRVGALLLGLLYLGLAPAYALVLNGEARTAAVTSAVVAVAACGALAFVATGASQPRARWILSGLYTISLSNTVLLLVVTRQVEQTALVMLTMVAIGATALSGRVVLVSIAAALTSWVVVAVSRELQPADQVVHFALQLGLASALAVLVFIMRVHVFERLERARLRISTQRDELAVLRAQGAADLEMLTRLVEASPVGLVVSDEEGRMIRVNRAMCQLVSREESELLGHDASAFTHPDDLEFISRSGDAILTSPDGVAKVETRYVRSDGEVIWVWLTLTHVAGRSGELWTLAHIQDITERKESEEQLRQTHQVVKAAGLVAHAVQLGENPRGVMVDQLRKVADATSVQFIEELDAERLVATTCSGQPDLTGTQIHLGETSVTVHVWRTGETIFVDDVSQHPLASPRLLEQANARSMMWTPVLVEGEVTGVVSIVWSQRVGHVTELQRAAVDAIVAEAGLALMSERVRHSLEEWSMTDPLTGLLNRRGWEHEVGDLDVERRRGGWPAIVALLDFDHFKAFNDRLGHSAGDTALSSFGSAANGARRTNDLVARWGGEEFAIALPDCPASAAHAALSRFARCVPGELTCSVGFTVLEPGEEIGDAIRRADKALYAAKAAGRNQIRGDAELLLRRGSSQSS